MSDKKKELQGLVIGLIALLCVAAFFVLGFVFGVWHIAWLVFLVIPIASIIVSLASEKKDIGGAITGIVAMLCVVAFAILGFRYGLWHPGWLVFLAIPITGIISEILKGKADSIIGLVALLCVIAFFVMGFTLGAWHLVWLVFLLIPISAIIRNMVKIVREQKDDGGDAPTDVPDSAE